MTPLKTLQEIERSDYYERKEREHIDLMECAWFAFKIGVIIACLFSIAGHVHELYRAF